MHPLTAQRLDLWRLKNFDGERLPSAEDTYLFHVVGEGQPERRAAHRDGRGARRDAAAGRRRRGRRLPDGGAAADRLPGQPAAGAGAAGGRAGRLDHNRIFLYAWPSIELPLSRAGDASRGSIAPLTVGAGLDQIVLLARLQEEPGGEPRDVALRFSNTPGHRRRPAGDRPADRADAPAGRLHAEGAPLPGPRARPTRTSWRRCWPGRGGTFVEHDLDDDGRLVPVDRPPGSNTAGIVAGLVTHADARATPRA